MSSNNEPVIITSLGLPFSPNTTFDTKPIGALNQVPSTTNQQSPLEFRLHIRRLPDVNYFVTKVNIPAVALPMASEATPFQIIPQPGDEFAWDPFHVEFRIGEGMNDWIQIWDWMLAIRSGKGYSRLSNNPEFTGYGVKSPILLAILDSSKNVIMSVDFNDAWPEQLTGLDFDTTMESPIQFLTAVVTFRYSTYSFRNNT